MFAAAEKAFSSTLRDAAPFLETLRGLICPPRELCEWAGETAQKTTAGLGTRTSQGFSCSPSSFITIESLAEVHQSIMDMVIADAGKSEFSIFLLQNLPRWVQDLPPKRVADKCGKDGGGKRWASAWTQLHVLRPIVQKYLGSSQEAGVIRFLKVRGSCACCAVPLCPSSRHCTALLDGFLCYCRHGEASCTEHWNLIGVRLRRHRRHLPQLMPLTPSTCY